MIFAETTKPTVGSAKEYVFMGPARDKERMELLDAGEGLRRARRITKPLFDVLVDAVQEDVPIQRRTLAAQALHAVLANYKEGLIKYYYNIGTIVDESDIIMPRIIGADGLGRRVTDAGLEIDAQPITPEIKEDFMGRAQNGVTHVAKQYEFWPADVSRMLQPLPSAHFSLGIMTSEGYQARQTVLVDPEQMWGGANTQQVAELQQTVQMLGVVKVAPRL